MNFTTEENGLQRVPVDGHSVANKNSASTGDGFVSESPAMKQIVGMVRRIAPSDAPVLTTGRTGVGKEVVADLVHRYGRPGQTFVKINCAALPRELIESELFGSVKGSFTGALTTRCGLFREAGDGTILLDEISEMPVETQAKLLRVLQDKQVRPVGGTTSFPINCRVISSTNRLPEEAIRDGKLRQDLFYRISAVRIHIPPLCERREDIVPIAQSCLEKFASENDRAATGLTQAAERFLLAQDWPGNVRELQNAIQFGVLMTDNQLLDVGDFLPKFGGVESPEPSSADTPANPNFTPMENMELEIIKSTLTKFAGNKKAAAKHMGIGRQTLFNKISRFGLPLKFGRPAG